MNNNETSSWISIVVSITGLIALVWAGVNEKYPAGMSGAIAAVVEPGHDAPQKLVNEVVEVPQPAVSSAPQSMFVLDITGEHLNASAVLPNGANDSKIWGVLSRHYKEPQLTYNLEFADSNEQAVWLDKLPEVLNQLLSGKQESELGLKIDPDSVVISGEVNSDGRKQEILAAAESLSQNGRHVFDRLTVKTVTLNQPSLQAVAVGNLLEVSGQLPDKYENSDLTENLKLAMGAGFVDDAIEYTDTVADSAFLTDLGRNLESVGNYGDNPAVYLIDGELKVKIASASPEASQELRAHLNSLMPDTPVSVEQVAGAASAELTVMTADVPVMKPVPMSGDDVEISQTPRLLEVNFAYNSFELLPGSLDVLDRLVVRLSSSPDLELVIEGHTDSTGNPDANLYLSQMRADSVKNYLIDSGIEENRLQSIGLGDVRPIASNGTRSGRSKNRRIEIRKGRS